MYQQKTRMKNNYWKELFMATPLPCLLIKPESPSTFVIVDANDAYLSLTQMERTDLLGKDFTDAFPENPEAEDPGLEIILKTLEDVRQSSQKIKLDTVRYDLPLRGTGTFQEKYWSNENIPLLGEGGETTFILHCIQDITEQVVAKKKEKEIQKELKINRQQFRSFIRDNPDGLFRLDLNGNFVHANEGLAKLAEVPIQEILSMDFLPFCAPNHKQRIWNQFQKATTGITNTFEADFISGKGKHLILKVILMPMELDGKITEVHGIAKDITSYRHTEKVMVEKSRFLNVNAAFINSLLENDLDGKALEDTFGIIGNTVEVDRMYYFGAHRDPKTEELLISQKVEWTSDNAEPQIDNPELQNMSSSQVVEIMGPLNENIPFTATLSELKDCLLKEIFLEQEIKSMLLLPIILENQLYGFIGFDDCTRERIWTEGEISFLQSLAHNFTRTLETRQAKTAIKLQEEHLKRSEKKFKALVQEGSDMMAILDMDGNYTFASENYKSVLGLSPAELLEKNAFHFINPEDWDRVKKQFSNLDKEKQVRISPFRFRNSEGKWRWIETTATNLLNEPAIEGIVANSRDVTTLIDQAREIEHINERYKLAATATQDLIYDWDLKNNKVVRFHRSQKDLFGFSSEEVNKKEFWQKHIHPDDFSEERRKLERILSNPEKNFIKTEYRFRRADGSYAKVIDKGYIIRDDSGKPIRLIGATSDVSDITAKKEALKVANDRFKMAMKATNEMIWDWEIGTDSVTRSKGYKKIFGYDTNEATSVHSFWLTKIAVKDQERVKNSLLDALSDKNQEKWREEYRIVKADGKVAHVADRGFIIRDENKKAIRMVGAVLDVTESRRLMREIKRQNKTLKEIAWEQSHVVRAPLARIKGLLHLLEEDHYEQMSKQEVLLHLRNSADELDNIVRGIVTKTEEIEIQHPKARVV